MGNIGNKIQDNFYSKFLNNPLIQKLFLKRIGRLLYLLIVALLITLIYVIDIDILSISTLVEIIATLIFILATIWRLNDIEWSRWWILFLLTILFVLYIDYEMITKIGVVALIGIIVVLSYLPSNSTKKLEIEEIENNIMIKNKSFDKKTTFSFILGLVIMFGGIYLFDRFKSNCLFSNVGTVEIFGEIDLMEDPDYISTSALNVIQQIEALDADPNIKGIVLDIASDGGGTESSESIMLAVQRTSKPVVAVIRDVGASGAYMIASAANRIYANKMSDIGSIGVTLEFLDTSEKDRREGVILYDFSSGKYKGAFKEHSKMTPEQREMIMKGIMKSHDIFVEYVSKNRDIPLEEVKKIATGESWVGEDALELGLIDQIGGMPEAGVWLKDKVGEEPDYCYMGESL